jgi:tRNA pseudouridine55 synthase
VFGILNINKPPGITSREVVNRVCKRLPKKTRVGHCGTLDPLATGVLIVCVGPATRLIQFGQSAPKRYLGTFRFGLSSDTEDITGDVKTIPGPKVNGQQIIDALPNFLGTIDQRPPAFSALRVGGKRAYDLARAGKEVKLEPRKIEISDIQLIDCAYPDFTLDIRCGSGTYVRSLGRDIAAALSTHAVMTALVRTEIGDFHQSDATPLNDFDSNPIERFLLPPESILGMMPRTVLVDDEFDKLQDGNWIRRDLPPEVEDLAAMDDAGRLVVVLKKDSGRLFVPKINFARHWKANQDQA